MQANIAPSTSKKPSSEEMKNHLIELDMTPSRFASYLISLGDYRSHSTVLRSIQRVLSGETVISGELFAIIQILLRRRRRLKRAVNRIVWTTDKRGDIHAVERNFKIKLHHFKNRSWQIHVLDQESDYSHPYPSYPDSLESAKIKALECLEEAEELLAEDLEEN